MQARSAARRSRQDSADWIVFSVHRPLLCSDSSEWDAHKPGAPIHKALGPLLHQYGVDLVLTGHEHAYERIHPTTMNGTVLALPTRKHMGADVYTNPGR